MAITRTLTLSLCICFLLFFNVCKASTQPITIGGEVKTETSDLSAKQLRIDSLFLYIDSEEMDSAEEFETVMAEIESLLTTDDIARQARFLRFQCRQFDEFQEGETEKAIAFATQSLAKPFMAEYHQDRLDLELCKSWHTERTGDFDTAVAGYSAVIKEATQRQELLLIADGRSIRGGLLRYQGQFSQALEDLIIAHDLYVKLDRQLEAENLLIGIATAFRQMGNYKNALKYYLQIEAKHTEDSNLDGFNYIQVMIGITEEGLGHLDEALNRFMQAYQYWEAQGDLVVRAEVAVNLASALIHMQDIPQAMTYLDEAEAVIEPDNFAIYSFMKLFRAQALLVNNQLDEAHINLEAARQSFDSVSNLRGTEQLLELESKLFFQQKNYLQAYTSLTRYLEVHQQLNRQRTSGQTIAMRTQFNSQQIELENKHLVENQKLKQHEVKILEINKLQQLIIIVMGSIILIILAILTFKQSQKNRLLSVLAMTDHLTQLPNRRHIYQKAQSFFEHARHNKHPFSVITFDADHFKLVNDTFGHETGDIALQHIANSAQSLMRNNQIVGRTGGEEFLILLPTTSLTAAMRIAKQLVNNIAATDFSEMPTGFSLTISAGVSTLQSSDQQVAALINRADDALYVAKNGGRNRAVTQQA